MKFERSLQLAKEWTDSAKLIFSAAKTVAMHLNGKFPGRDLILEVEGNSIRFSTSVRYLGVIIDQSRLYVEHEKQAAVKSHAKFAEATRLAKKAME